MSNPNDPSPYNPLDKANLARSVADQLLAKIPEPLGKITPFLGAGVYAIYYNGDFVEYASVAKSNTQGDFLVPIYVGKAIPKGGRIGVIDADAKPGLVLYNRLREHAESVAQAQNLSLEDFWCRYLVVDDIWVPLTESMLINTHRPIWNVSLSGFGNHDPGRGRYGQKRSPWDTVHPGRTWAVRCADYPLSAEQILTELHKHHAVTEPQDEEIQ
ncbi:MAG: Eco29kI family restriction endonuclease [Capsulimonas sp.]|uniref:Eco29kI family restriction endonuclease n=1 Tax=Capsulimonas sp. TaxID=2494211 RepID=UPI0032659644